MWIWCRIISLHFEFASQHLVAGREKGVKKGPAQDSLPHHCLEPAKVAREEATGTFHELWAGCLRMLHLRLLLPSWICGAIKVKHQVQASRKPFHWWKGLVLLLLFHFSNMLLLHLADDLLRAECHCCHSSSKYSRCLPCLTQLFHSP